MSYIRETIRGKDEWTVYEQIGFAVSCMLYNRNYSLYPVLTIQYWTEYAIQHNQIKFLFDSRGFPLAYITWAYLEADTEARLLRIQNSGCIRLNGMKMEGSGFWISVVNQALVEKLLTISYKQPWGEGEVRWLSRRKKIVTYIPERLHKT